MHDRKLLDLVTERHRSLGRPIVVGISGYCGSGKSALARRLTDKLPAAYRLRGDDFLDPKQSHRRSSNWDGVDRPRLVSDVFLPVREKRPSTFQRYDWSKSRLSQPEPLRQADILVIDLIGLFHPEALPALDLTIWCDVDLEIAAERGMARDAASAATTRHSGKTCGYPTNGILIRSSHPATTQKLSSQQHDRGSAHGRWRRIRPMPTETTLPRERLADAMASIRCRDCCDGIAKEARVGLQAFERLQRGLAHLG